MRHAAAGGGGARRKPMIAEYCSQALGAQLVRSLLIAAARAERAVEKPRLAKKNVHRAALDALCVHARQLHSRGMEQHVEEQRMFTLRGLQTNIDLARLQQYEAEVQQMATDIRAVAGRTKRERYDPITLSLPENSLRLVCDFLRTRHGEALEPEDHALLLEFGPGAREHLDKLVLGALAVHCETLEANIACNARAAAPLDWAGCMQQARVRAAAAEVNQRRQASTNIQQLRDLNCTLEEELQAETAKRAAGVDAAA